jgi:predicted  nucleic acid-binding Zn-ribbon protein
MRQSELLAALEEWEGRLAALLAESEAAARRAGPDPVSLGLVRQREEGEARLRQRTSALRQLELEAASLKERATRHERALYDGSVRNPADLQRRQHELDSLRSQLDSLDERQLEQIELVEEDERELARLDQALQERAQDVAAARRADEQRAPAHAQAVAAARAEIAGLTAQLPESVLRTYRRIAQRRQPAVARVVGSTCSGCRLPLPHRIVEELHGEQLVLCENCERILLL